ncbi:MAG: hypothetical protein JXB62_15615 [Pirellulales bacterium]|nr:hypothetical protein [Pirellulales bacterium]
MSDSLEMLADVDVTVEAAEDISCAVLDRFRTLGVITGKTTAICALGGKGFRPGPAVADL